MWFEEDGETDERRSWSSFLRQRVTDGLILPTTGSRSMQSALLPPANGLVPIALHSFRKHGRSTVSP